MVNEIYLGNTSIHTSERLPYSWLRIPNIMRSNIVYRLVQSGTCPYSAWTRLPTEDRITVYEHVRACEKVLERPVTVNIKVDDTVRKVTAEQIESIRAYGGGREGGKSTFQSDWYNKFHPAKLSTFSEWAVKYPAVMKQGSYMLYPKPNGGNRILPSEYTKLTTTWLQANGNWLMPAYMNEGHLQATLNLLKESHGNLIAKSTSLLGRVASHLRNSPEIVAKLEELCLAIQRVEVDEVYPIFQPLSNTLAEKQDAREMAEFDKYEVTGDFGDWEDYRKW